MSLNKADAEFMVNALLSQQFRDRLSSWEEEFAHSIQQQVSDDVYPLSPKQAETLERIFDRINR